MLDKETRTAILALAAKERSQREIAQALKVSRNSVRAVLASGSAEPAAAQRGSVLDEYLEAIQSLHEKCRNKRGQANLVRVREKLSERLRQEGKLLEVSYATFTRFCRERGIGAEEKTPAGRIVTAPGEEMQHDTSPYDIELGGKKMRRHGASLVLGYSRMLYLQFYARFDRFHMKIFLTEAFEYFLGLCRRCVIDNTSCAIALGSGNRAQMSPEVEAFEERFGFRFLAHEVGHCDRKGKIERPFHFIENNFLVGREFKDDDDLNLQALEWLEAANRRRLREFKASPLELFAAEKGALPHFHVSRQNRVIGQDGAGANAAIMPQVRHGHQHHVVAHLRDATRLGAAMHGDVFADHAAAADHGITFRAGEVQILRFVADHGTGVNMRAFADFRPPGKVHMRSETAIVPDLHMVVNDGEGTNFDIHAEAGADGNDGRGVDHGGITLHVAYLAVMCLRTIRTARNVS